MAQPFTLLLTRPQAASQRFAKQIEAELGNVHTLIAPIMEIELLDFEPPHQDASIVFTSPNGVAAWERAGLPGEHRCFCVAEATGDAARALGFSPEISGGTVVHLLADLCKHAPQGEIVHVHGRHTAGDLVGDLQARGFDAKHAIAYEQGLLELNPEARQLLDGGEPVVVPLFSPRSAMQFAKAGPFGPQVDLIAISEAAAQQCPGARIAPSPDAKGMIAAILQGPFGSSST